MIIILMQEMRELTLPAMGGEGYPRLHWELATESFQMSKSWTRAHSPPPSGSLWEEETKGEVNTEK